ncbi:EAL domain-containing protein [Marinobacter sp. LV10MA510-1]|uniref:EAL domain-containing protein n=1 Tax=Marinobacter sp. LV10MA510-1 TaxID=1415567 RepID=UPI000BF5396B|nr:EAL domain-containing protein [Marinobacter sp. LV10MA510-1]PFG10941.1 diguanylate cyclase/phosphodiesterase with PAS/PAC sensor(s) [Marinobacter sp. LV10MA510-1]
MKKQENRTRSSSAAPYRLPIALYIFALLGLVVSAGYVAQNTYKQAKETAIGRSVARADLAAELVANRLFSTGYGLRALAGFVQLLVHQPNTSAETRLENIESYLDQKVSSLGFIDKLFVADPASNFFYPSIGKSVTKTPDWPFIASYLSGNPSREVVTPLYTDPETGDLWIWIWMLSQLHSDTGNISAVIVARQSPEMLSESFARLSLSDGQSIAIIDESMKLVARIPTALKDTSSLGKVVNRLEIRRFIDSDSSSYQAVFESYIDGEKRFYAFKRVPGAPYIVVVGEKASVALQDWYQSLWVGATGILLVAIIGLFFLRQFFRRLSVENALLHENRERRLLQQSAQTNESRLQALVSSIPDLIFVFDEQGRFTFVHAQDKSQLLMPAEKLPGLHYSKVLPPELAAQLDQLKVDVGKTEKTLDFEYQLFFEGGARDFAARVSALRDITGESGGYMAVVRDVTESKFQQAELRIASTAFETHLGIMITDERGVILRTNKAFSRITGYTEHDVVGQNPRMLQSGLQDLEFYQHLWGRVRKEGSWEGEIWNLRKNGEEFAEWLTITAVYGQSGIVQNYVGTFHDITQRKEAEQKAHQLAFYDPLTGLANKALLDERISGVRKNPIRQNAHAALLYVDVEQLRAVNDSRGYGFGDLVLKALAGQLAGVVRESDTLARIGGDEFAILLSSRHASQEVAARSAESVAEKILSAFTFPIKVLEQTIQVSVSIGIILIDGHTAAPDEQLQKAEQATQQAKERAKLRGEKRISFFDSEIQAKVVQHVLMEEELRNALAEEQLVLYYQPQIRNPDQLVGYEVLLRWRHPKRGIVSPGVFIPIAEQSRLILPIGRWIIEQACEKLAAWQSEPARSELSLAVNVSVVQFQSDNFVDHVGRILEKTGAPPHLLKLEVTESLLMDDPERITGMMKRLRSMGVRFSLDDFGTGYSSMSYLNQLPLDQIKIDQSFITEVATNPASSAIVVSIIGLAKGLNLEVIAEGVETEEQRNWLANHGCKNFQGYLFGRPEEI